MPRMRRSSTRLSPWRRRSSWKSSRKGLRRPSSCRFLAVTVARRPRASTSAARCRRTRVTTSLWKRVSGTHSPTRFGCVPQRAFDPWQRTRLAPGRRHRQVVGSEHRIRCGLIAALAAAGVLHAHTATSAEADARTSSAPALLDESQVKAAFLYNFIKFIEWPQTLFADAQSPYVIGVLSRNPISTELERLVQGRSI